MKKGKKRFLLAFISLVSLIFLVSSGFYLFFLDALVVKKFEGQRWKLPSKIYSAPFILSSGVDIEKTGLASRLKRLSYHPVKTPVRNPGEFFLSDDEVQIYLHEFAYPDHVESGYPVSLSLSEGKKIARIMDLTLAIDVDYAVIEPEVIGGFYEAEWEERRLVRIEEIPQSLIDAVMVMEDRRFYEHMGINFKSILRAAWINLKAGKIVQGGSTLTQQLVKNFYLASDRTWRRKANEALMALLLERRYSKEEILEVYLNEIYFGQNGVMGVYGVGQGSMFHFMKRPSELTLGESALLAGIIRSPNIYSPKKNIRRAVRRRNLVLENLFSEGKIDLKAYMEARAEKVSGRKLKQRLNAAPYFVDEIRKRMADIYPPRVLISGGLQIFTTLDVELQRIADEALKTGLSALENRKPRLKRDDPKQRLQGALVAIDPGSGAVRAMVGGRDYGVSQFNRATQARRQPGSLFKPLVYLTAFEQAATGGTPYTPVSLVDDAPITLQVGGKEWSPENYDKQYNGPVTLQAALERSLNTATVRLSQEVGIENIMNTAQKIGITSPLSAIPSLALGSLEVSPLEIGMAYGTLANQGVRQAPKFLLGVIDPAELPLDPEKKEEDASPGGVSAPAAYLVTHLLKGVVESGTGRGVRTLGFEKSAAGKTGTTTDGRDAWFAGYTPDLVTVVWIGFDQQQRGALSGSSAALPIWTKFMKKGDTGNPGSDFLVPSGIIFRSVNDKGQVCREDGKEVPFIEGTEPEESCRKGLFKWLEGLFF
ncbi:MAG: PBP1A family penicillin-binding protein [Nitrospiria bacterium]